MLVADRYELDELPLGRGGMSAVHAGHDKHLDRRVAVKFLQFPGGPDDELRRRFIREARILARLEHAGAPVLYDFGTFERRLFQVMQYIEGVTVADLLGEHGALPVSWAAAITAQACAVLCAAHSLSICHRDLKPTNLMLCPDGSVKVLDFGLAMLREADVAQFTRAGQILGTPAYMAPEQIQRGAAGPRSDLYALGLPAARDADRPPAIHWANGLRGVRQAGQIAAAGGARRAGRTEPVARASCWRRTRPVGPLMRMSCISGSRRSRRPADAAGFPASGQRAEPRPDVCPGTRAGAGGRSSRVSRPGGRRCSGGTGGFRRRRAGRP